MKLKYLIALLLISASCTKKKEVKVEESAPEKVEIVIPQLPPIGEISPFLEVNEGMKRDGSWQIVYNGQYVDNKNDFVILDLFEFNEADIKKCKFPIAYFSAHYEDWRPDKNQFGKKLSNIQGWKGEKYIEWTDPKNKQVMLNRLDLAVKKGFKGVDIDNVDGPKTSAYFGWLLEESKKRGLAVGLKNSVEVLGEFGDKVDFFVSEASDESELTCYKKYNKPVVRMYYGKGAKTPAYIVQVRNGVAGNRF